MGILAHHTDAAPQVPLLATEQNFAAIHGRFKINFLLSDGSGYVYYGQEANASVADMMEGKVAEVVLDARQGYLDCVYKAQGTKGDWETAVVYRKQNGQWKAVRWYMRNEQPQVDYIVFANHKARCQVVVKDRVLSLYQLETVVA